MAKPFVFGMRISARYFVTTDLASLGKDIGTDTGYYAGRTIDGWVYQFKDKRIHTPSGSRWPHLRIIYASGGKSPICTGAPKQKCSLVEISSTLCGVFQAGRCARAPYEGLKVH